MDPFAFVYVALFAVLMGVWFTTQEYLAKRGLSKSLAMAISGLGTGGLIALSWYRWHSIPPVESLWWFVLTITSAAILAEFLARAAFAHGPSMGANATGLAPAVAVLCGWLILGEVPGWLAIVGIGTIMAGLYVIHWNPRLAVGWLGPVRNMWGSWLLYAVCLALSAGFAMVVSKPCVELTDPLMAPGIQLFCAFGIYGIIRGLVVSDLHSPGMKIGKKELALLGVLMASFAVANWAQAELYLHTEAASVGALKRGYTPVTVIMAWLVLGQRRNLATLLTGSTLVFIGAVCIGYA